MAPDRASDLTTSAGEDCFRTDSFHADSFHTDADARYPTATWSDWSCTVRVVVTRPGVLADAVALVRNRMRRVERVASRFVVDSDLNWANANSGRPIAVPGLLVELVDAALDGARRSGGALDPTIGRHLAAIGYDRDILLVTDRADDPALDDPALYDPALDDLALERTVAAGPTGRTWRDVGLDRDLGLLTVPRGTALDLGATAKAQTADWAAHAVQRRFGGAVMVEIGGDLAVAGARPDGDWQITVAERAGACGQQIGVRRGGMATSTTTVRTWRRGEVRLHHIVDPRTARPTNGPWRTVSVAAESALEANVCSTAAIVLGDRAVDWLERQPVAARLVDADGRVTTLGGWPPDPASRPARVDTVESLRVDTAEKSGAR